MGNKLYLYYGDINGIHRIYKVLWPKKLPKNVDPRGKAHGKLG